MGTYGLNEEEIENAITNALTEAQGDLDSFQLRRVFKKILDEYPYTIDRDTCHKCLKMYQLYKTEKSLNNGVWSWVCTHCGNDNMADKI